MELLHYEPSKYISLVALAYGRCGDGNADAAMCQKSL
jgi:hypothetical protein